MRERELWAGRIFEPTVVHLELKNHKALKQDRLHLLRAPRDKRILETQKVEDVTHKRTCARIAVAGEGIAVDEEILETEEAEENEQWFLTPFLLLMAYACTDLADEAERTSARMARYAPPDSRSTRVVSPLGSANRRKI